MFRSEFFLLQRSEKLDKKHIKISYITQNLCTQIILVWDMLSYDEHEEFQRGLIGICIAHLTSHPSSLSRPPFWCKLFNRWLWENVLWRLWISGTCYHLLGDHSIRVVCTPVFIVAPCPRTLVRFPVETM